MWPWLATAGSYLFTALGRVQCPPVPWEHHGVLCGPAALWTHIAPAAHVCAYMPVQEQQETGIEATVKMKFSFKMRVFGGEWR